MTYSRRISSLTTPRIAPFTQRTSRAWNKNKLSNQVPNPRTSELASAKSSTYLTSKIKTPAMSRRSCKVQMLKIKTKRSPRTQQRCSRNQAVSDKCKSTQSMTLSSYCLRSNADQTTRKRTMMRTTMVTWHVLLTRYERYLSLATYPSLALPFCLNTLVVTPLKHFY